jgi:hypothetical protein
MDDPSLFERRWIYPLILIVIVLIVRFFFG